MPSFRYACRYRPDVLAVVLRQLKKRAFAMADAMLGREVDLYNGDMIEGGRGEILVRAA